MDFKVGDKVYVHSSLEIGVITKITPKTAQITVDFGHYKEKYNKHGASFGNDAWSIRYIYPLDDETEKEIKKEVRKKKLVYKIERQVWSYFSLDQLERINQILLEVSK